MIVPASSGHPLVKDFRQIPQIPYPVRHPEGRLVFRSLSFHVCGT